MSRPTDIGHTTLYICAIVILISHMLILRMPAREFESSKRSGDGSFTRYLISWKIGSSHKDLWRSLAIVLLGPWPRNFVSANFTKLPASCRTELPKTPFSGRSVSSCIVAAALIEYALSIMCCSWIYSTAILRRHSSPGCAVAHIMCPCRIASS